MTSSRQPAGLVLAFAARPGVICFPTPVVSAKQLLKTIRPGRGSMAWMKLRRRADELVDVARERREELSSTLEMTDALIHRRKGRPADWPAFLASGNIGTISAPPGGDLPARTAAPSSGAAVPTVRPTRRRGSGRPD